MLQPLQQEFGSGAIVEVGGLHAVLQQIALCINEQMTLAVDTGVKLPRPAD